MEEICEKLNHVLQEFHRLGVEKQVDFEKLYLYSIVTHSTAIEGSTVTEIENALMFDEGIVPGGRNVTEQLMNLDLKRAYDFVKAWIPQKQEITVELLRKLSAMVMRNTGSVYHTALGSFDSSQGDFRLVNVSAGRGGRSYLSYQKIPQRVEDFCLWLNKARRSVLEDEAAIYAMSFEAHYRLVSIHPWVDGNGRMCRLLTNLLQMERNLLPSVVRKEDKAKYIEALAASQEAEDSNVFVSFMLKALMAFVTQSIEEYGRAWGV